MKKEMQGNSRVVDLWTTAAIYQKHGKQRIVSPGQVATSRERRRKAEREARRKKKGVCTNGTNLLFISGASCRKNRLQ